MLSWGPIFAALSASSPIYKGKLSNIDMRWKVIAQSVDCRTEEERDPSSDKYIPKSRYESANYYLSNHAYVKPDYNDATPIPTSQKHINYLREQNVDERLANHVATLFSRDPIPAFSSEFEEQKHPTTAHFENL